MISKKELLKMLPPFKNDGVLIVEFQNEKDIKREILNAHKQFKNDYAAIAQYFWTGDLYTSCREIWNFLKDNFKYCAESEEEQSSKSPARMLATNEKIDCKHYSLFIGGILSAIHDQYDTEFTWCYRFAGYKNYGDVEHVFVVVDPGTNDEIWIDPVLKYFDLHEQPIYYIDSKIMALYRLSGVSKINGVTVQVDTELARRKFLTMVIENVFGWKDLLKRNPDIVDNQLQAYFSPIDFIILKNAING